MNTNKLIARYFSETNTIAIYNDCCKLVEFPLKDKGLWGFPSFDFWKKECFGYEIQFSFIVSGEH